MNPRRGFLALVGGSLLSGSVLHNVSAQAPSLVLPPSLGLVPARSARPLVAAHKSEMHAIIHVKQALPPEDFDVWLSVGLRMAAAAERRA